MTTKTRKKTIKLDIACGKAKQKGHLGIDISPECEADIVHDLTVYPWPIEDNGVREAYCSHYVEHIPMEVTHFEATNGDEPTVTTRNGMIAFMEEVYRILKPGGQITIIHPHNRTDRAFQDPTHTRFIPEAHWFYWAKDWREANGLDHYPITTDFGIEQMFYNGYQDIAATPNRGNWSQKSEDARAFAQSHHWNVAMDLVVVLKKR